MYLEIKDIKKSFKKKEVIRGANYKFENGKIYGLLGRNGAGKTTLFNVLYKELEKDGGSVEFNDGSTTRDLEIDDIGMVFAETHLPEFLTGYEYIKFIIDIKDTNDIANIDRYFDYMNISEKDRYLLIKDYSSGMKSKLALLSIYIQKPKVILLDEPLTAVDVISGVEIKEFFKSLRNDHIIIVSTHILDLAKDLCDEIVLLDRGVLKALENLEKDENYEEKIIEALRDSSND